MLEQINFDKPVYSAVNIKIRKPEVNNEVGMTNPCSVNCDSGIYNAVKIDIDNPRVNTRPMQVYDYPEAENIVTYDMIGVDNYSLPQGFPVAEQYQPSKIEEVSEDEQSEPEEKAPVPEVPEPNYTTTENEKGITNGEVSFHGTDSQVKKPEIVPPEPIVPKVNIAKVKENLNSPDYDVQALQMEEIVKAALVSEDNAKQYLINDVFTGLINIAEKDVTNLAPPTKEQNDARQKIIGLILAAEKNPKAAKQLESQISDKDIALANNLSPMELAIRNKEYALATIGVLSNTFINQVQKHESRVIPITDVPGVSTVANVLRKDPDSGVKLAAIDALRLISRPEYKEEISALYTMVQTDKNPTVSRSAAMALTELNQIS